VLPGDYVKRLNEETTMENRIELVAASSYTLAELLHSFIFKDDEVS